MLAAQRVFCFWSRMNEELSDTAPTHLRTFISQTSLLTSNAHTTFSCSSPQSDRSWSRLFFRIAGSRTYNADSSSHGFWLVISVCSVAASLMRLNGSPSLAFWFVLPKRRLQHSRSREAPAHSTSSFNQERLVHAHRDEHWKIGNSYSQSTT